MPKGQTCSGFQSQFLHLAPSSRDLDPALCLCGSCVENVKCFCDQTEAFCRVKQFLLLKMKFFASILSDRCGADGYFLQYFTIKKRVIPQLFTLSHRKLRPDQQEIHKTLLPAVASCSLQCSTKSFDLHAVGLLSAVFGGIGLQGPLPVNAIRQWTGIIPLMQFPLVCPGFRGVINGNLLALWHAILQSNAVLKPSLCPRKTRFLESGDDSPSPGACPFLRIKGQQAARATAVKAMTSVL